MKNLIIAGVTGLAGLVTGCVTGWVVKDIQDKKLDEKKELIDSSLDEDVDIFNQIEDPMQRKAFIQNYYQLIKDGYHAKEVGEVLTSFAEIQNLINDISDIVEDAEPEDDDDHSKRMEELLNSMLHSMGVKLVVEPEQDEMIPDNKTSNQENPDKEFIHPVKIQVEEAMRYKEVDDNGNDVCERDNENPDESEPENTEETLVEEELSTEEQSTLQSSENVSVEDEVATSEEPDADEDDEVDEEKFSTLLEYFGRPLLNRFGDEYEDRLLKMIDCLSRKNLDPGVYDEYTTRLKSVINYHKDMEKGKRKLNNIISAFFSMYPVGPEEE